jgi:hypothetical protein
VSRRLAQIRAPEVDAQSVSGEEREVLAGQVRARGWRVEDAVVREKMERVVRRGWWKCIFGRGLGWMGW